MDLYLQLFYLMSVPAIFSAEPQLNVSTRKEVVPDTGHLMLDFNWPHPKTGVQRYPHLTSCKHFYFMESENKYKLRKCPNRLAFDFISLTCKRKTLAQCWSSQFSRGYKPLNSEKHFHCPVPWGNYPDVLDCKKYFHCHGFQGTPKQCPKNALFDKFKRHCVAYWKATCSSTEGNVERYYKCPRAWGAFPYSRDCSKYHKCVRKIPMLRKCQAEYLFNSTSRKCHPKSEVDCGHRYNPYDPKVTTGASKVSHTSSEGISVETVSVEELSPSQFSTEMSGENLMNSTEEISDESNETFSFSVSEKSITDVTDSIASTETTMSVNESHEIPTVASEHGNISSFQLNLTGMTGDVVSSQDGGKGGLVTANETQNIVKTTEVVTLSSIVHQEVITSSVEPAKATGYSTDISVLEMSSTVADVMVSSHEVSTEAAETVSSSVTSSLFTISSSKEIPSKTLENV